MKDLFCTEKNPMFIAELYPEAGAKVGVIPSLVSDLNQQQKVFPQGDQAFFEVVFGI